MTHDQAYDQLDDISDSEVERLIAEANSYSMTPATRYQYMSRWKRFDRDCTTRELPSLPADPSTVLKFLIRRSRSTRPQCVTLDRSAIRRMHINANLPDPTSVNSIAEAVAGLKRQYGTMPKKKKALRTENVRMICRNFDEQGGLIAMRDKASIVLGYAGAFRSCEVTTIRIEHVEFSIDGVAVTLPHSKTDQEGHGAVVAIPRGEHPQTCPVLATEEFLAALADRLAVGQLKSGWLFPGLREYSRRVRVYDTPVCLNRYRSGIKDAVAAIGLDPAEYSGHSCRAGHATTAARGGANRADIMAQGRWRSADVVDGYIQEGRQFLDNSGNSLGL